MKMNQEELRGRVNTCVDFLARALDKNKLATENQKFQDNFKGLNSILMQMSMYLAEFNFYPSEFHTDRCCQVSFFTSLSGSRWNLKNSERISFDRMFKNLIRHCQGFCLDKTNYAVLIVDNWDDDIAKFWEYNIQRMKEKGVIIEVRMMIGSKPNVYEL